MEMFSSHIPKDKVNLFLTIFAKFKSAQLF